jgi:hypothetical protein
MARVIACSSVGLKTEDSRNCEIRVLRVESTGRPHRVMKLEC